MQVDDLYNSNLIQPIRHGANRLFIISGYASATFARRHVVDLLKINNDFEINLLVGMPSARVDHLAFLQLIEEYNGRFKGYYFQGKPSVHCKVYSWFLDDKPFIGFAGSANYSQFGFFPEEQLNQLSKEDPIEIKILFDKLLKSSIFMPRLEIILPKRNRIPKVKSVPPGQIEWEIPNKRVTISFLDRKGFLPKISGLNWGQREEKRTDKKTGKVTFVKREPNQAYLSLKGTSRKEGFLPETAFTFTLITDDGNSFDCVVAQEGRKAIHTTNDNSLMGRYFRDRIGVPLGSLVTVDNLESYGRTDYTLEKIDEETFLLDFSVN